MRMPGKKIDEGTRQKVRDAYARGLSMRAIAKELGIGSSSVDRIVKEDHSHSGRGLTPDREKRIQELERRISDLEKKILELKAKRKSWKR
jgi:predicted transcriptional regulator